MGHSRRKGGLNCTLNDSRRAGRQPRWHQRAAEREYESERESLTAVVAVEGVKQDFRAHFERLGADFLGERVVRI